VHTEISFTTVGRPFSPPFCHAGACATAPGDGVSAANVAARTLHVAKQYIQHRKVRDERSGENCMSSELMQTPDEYLDRPLVSLSSHSGTAFDSAFIGTHASGNGSDGKGVMNGTYVNGNAVNGVR
jgi:hypothetical protein